MKDSKGLIIRPNPAVMVGTHALLKHGRVVWTGPLGAPIEDAECDEIHMHPKDYQRVILEAKRKKL